MLRLRTIAVVVSDEKRAASWYREKLGMKLEDAFPHWHTVATSGSDVQLHLCPDAPLEPGNSGIAFTAKDCKKEEAALRKRGARIVEPTTKADWGTYFTFADPDGNEFWVVEE
jgi:predicted enzyme related to lactoylglutathione lyase